MTTRTEESAIGLIAWLEATRVRLPLKAVDCHFNVFGDIADVRIDQVFEQNNTAALDVSYTFPLPADAAVYGCEMIVNGRVIRAVVKEENEARELAAKLKAEGRRVARTEAPRENLFSLELGNVQPGDVIVIRLRYFQILDRIGQAVSLSIPTCPGIRYIPGKPLLRSDRGKGVVGDTDKVPDASRISPPRMSELHPDAAYFAVEGSLAAEGADPESVSSPSHAVLVESMGARVAVRLAGEGDAVPDRDFILRWSERAGSVSARSLSARSGAHTYAAVRVAAPSDLPDAQGEPKDVYLLLDRSGSMGGIKWKKAVEALGRFAHELAPHDRVFLTLFDSDHIDFDERPITAEELLADPAFHTIGEDEGPRGGTELLPALRHILEKVAQHSSNRPTSIVLITDGEVGNEAEVRRAVAGANHVKVHCFGVDTTVNDALLKGLARDTGGACALLSPHDNIPAAVAAMAVRMRKPALLDLKAARGWEPARVSGDAGADVHAGEAVTLVFRGPGTATELRLVGRRADGTAAEFAFPIEPDSSEAPRLLWAKHRMSDLLAAGRRGEAVALAIEHNLVCEGTSFLAWDEAEQVPVAKRELYQPSMAPGEWEAACSLPGVLASDAGIDMMPSISFCPGSSPMVFGIAGAALRTPTSGGRKRSRKRVHKAALELELTTAEELCNRYSHFAQAGLPFPIAEGTIRGKHRYARLRDKILLALRPLGEPFCQIVVGILMTWLVRAGLAMLAERARQLEEIARNFPPSDLPGALRRIAQRISGEEAQVLHRLLALIDSDTAQRTPHDP